MPAKLFRYSVCLLALALLPQAWANAEPEPEDILAALRAPQIDGGFCFVFELEHRPSDRSQPRQQYIGQLFGQQDFGQTNYRITLIPDPRGEEIKPGNYQGQALAIFAGAENAVTRAELAFPYEAYTSPQDWQRSNLQTILGADLLQPVLPEFVYTYFELQMPFLYWPEWEYLGEERAKGRNTHVFDMYPPEALAQADSGMSAVRIYVDHKFAALLKAEVLDKQGEPAKTFKINKIKKVQERYIVRQIDLFDERTRDKTRFTVTAAATGLDLAPEIFKPAALLSAEPIVPHEAFEQLD